jgi:hypothetical protein
MSMKQNQPPPATPVRELERLMDHLWDSERQHYGMAPSDRHLFVCLVEVAKWLTNYPEGTADEYFAASRVMPEIGWRFASIGGQRDCLLHALPITDGDEPLGEPAWWDEGFGNRFRLAGRSGSLTVILGWDRPLDTFFAQVWDVPAGADHYEQGKLLRWVGVAWEEVPRVEDLQHAIAPFADIPPALAVRLTQAQTNLR